MNEFLQANALWISPAISVLILALQVFQANLSGIQGQQSNKKQGN